MRKIKFKNHILEISDRFGYAVIVDRKTKMCQELEDFTFEFIKEILGEDVWQQKA